MVNPPENLSELARDLKKAHYEAKLRGIQWARGSGHLYYDRAGTIHASAIGLLLLKASNWNYTVARKLLFERPFNLRVNLVDKTGKHHRTTLWSLINDLESGACVDIEAYPVKMIDDYPRYQEATDDALTPSRIADWLLYQHKAFRATHPASGRYIANISQNIANASVN